MAWDFSLPFMGLDNIALSSLLQDDLPGQNMPAYLFMAA